MNSLSRDYLVGGYSVRVSGQAISTHCCGPSRSTLAFSVQVLSIDRECVGVLSGRTSSGRSGLVGRRRLKGWEGAAPAGGAERAGRLGAVSAPRWECLGGRWRSSLADRRSSGGAGDAGRGGESLAGGRLWEEGAVEQLWLGAVSAPRCALLVVRPVLLFPVLLLLLRNQCCCGCCCGGCCCFQFC